MCQTGSFKASRHGCQATHVMHEIVFDVPSLRLHPVAPIHKPPPRTPRKICAMESVLDPNLFAVSAVRHVVANHGPSGADSGAQAQRRNRIPWELGKASRQQSDRVEDVRGVQDLIEMLDIFLALAVTVFSVVFEGQYVSDCTFPRRLDSHDFSTARTSSPHAFKSRFLRHSATPSARPDARSACIRALKHSI